LGRHLIEIATALFMYFREFARLVESQMESLSKEAISIGDEPVDRPGYCDGVFTRNDLFELIVMFTLDW
jgi:hypothetical protein